MAHPTQWYIWNAGADSTRILASMVIAILLIAVAGKPAQGQTFTTLHALVA